MRRNFIIVFQLLVACCCFGQSIDTSALHILQKSYDKLAAMESIAYKMTTVDTMIRENSLNVHWYTIPAIIKKNAYWHFRLENNVE